MADETPRRLIDLLPDVRGWATIGMFALVFYLLHLISTHPELKDNELFKTVATLLIGSGAFGLVCSFLWGGSKASVSAVDTVNAVAKQASAPTLPASPASPSATPEIQPDVPE
jgi:hypothetical protein